jgi:hypothetical protein
MFITRPGFYDDVARNCVQNRNPLYENRVQGVPLLQIYKLTGASMERQAHGCNPDFVGAYPGIIWIYGWGALRALRPLLSQQADERRQAVCTNSPITALTGLVVVSTYAQTFSLFGK